MGTGGARPGKAAVFGQLEGSAAGVRDVCAGVCVSGFRMVGASAVCRRVYRRRRISVPGREASVGKLGLAGLRDNDRGLHHVAQPASEPVRLPAGCAGHAGVCHPLEPRLSGTAYPCRLLASVPLRAADRRRKRPSAAARRAVRVSHRPVSEFLPAHPLRDLCAEVQKGARRQRRRDRRRGARGVRRAGAARAGHDAAVRCGRHLRRADR